MRISVWPILPSGLVWLMITVASKTAFRNSISLAGAFDDQVRGDGVISLWDYFDVCSCCDSPPCVAAAGIVRN